MEKRRAKWHNGLAIAGIALICASGCTNMPVRRASESGEAIRIEKPLGVSATLRFEDVPIPSGFNNIRDQSFVFQDASMRVGLLRYFGRANADQVIAFFRSQMALYNWDLQNIIEHGISTMNFIKSDETCVITIEPMATKTVLSVVISPKKGTMTTGFGLRREKF